MRRWPDPSWVIASMLACVGDYRNLFHAVSRYLRSGYAGRNP